MCIYWSEELGCQHPRHNNAECDYDGICPEYVDEEEPTKENDELLDFILEIIKNSANCKNCIHNFYGGCIEAYNCISHDFSEYDEGDN